MEYENKTNEELIELLEAKDDEISELQETEQNIEELTDVISDYQSQEEDYNLALADREQVSEKSFYAGRISDQKLTPLKAWLNHKIEERL